MQLHRVTSSRQVRPVVAGLVSLMFLVGGAAADQIAARSAQGARGAVATVHPVATDTALTVLQQGGNAVDAAVAAALMLGVVDGHNSGIGGGCFILVRQTNGEVMAIDGREKAPRAASRDMYIRRGEPQGELSQVGPLAVAVPGALAAYEEAVRRAGRRNLSDLIQPAIEVASRGFVIDETYAERLAESAPLLARFPASRAMLLKADDRPHEAGERLVLSDLAETYRQIAQHGSSWFYRGPFARRMEQWMHSHGGLITSGDLAEYEVQIREPIVSTYRGLTIIGFPPPSSGGIHVAQILNILENFDLSGLYQRDPALWMHIIAQAMELAFADRAYWLGDADFVAVPQGLIDKEYARQLAMQIRRDRRAVVTGHGFPPEWQQRHFSGHTTHIAVADGDGNWVGITTTVNTSFGSKVVLPGTGVVLNNQMDDFAIAPGQPNAFGLIGVENNAIAPGKRPLSSMSPTLVFKEGQPVMTLGAAGGPTIISQVVLTLVRVVDLGESLEEAVAAPRFHQQWVPDRLDIEPRVGPRAIQRLSELGHHIHRDDQIGVTQAIGRRDSNLVGVYDDRVSGKAAAW